MVDFFKTPTDTLVNKNSFKQNLKEFFQILLYFYLATFINHIFISLIDIGLKIYSNFSFRDLIDALQNNASANRSFFFFLVFAPIVEEIIFRLPLKIKKLNLFISLAVAFLFFYYLSAISSMATLKFFLIFIPYLICLGFLIFFVVKTSFLENFKEKYYIFYFYGLSVIFGLLHLTNFIEDVPNKLILFSPIFTFFQIISGVFLSYTRIKYGLIWSIALHMIINLPATIRYFF
jgi:hypothetical protein